MEVLEEKIMLATMRMLTTMCCTWRWFGVVQSGNAMKDFERTVVRLIGPPDLIDHVVLVVLVSLMVLLGLVGSR